MSERRVARGASVVAAIAGIAALTAVPAAGAKSRAGLSAQTGSSGAAHLYWSEPEASRGPSGHGIDNVWRANLNGTGIDRHFITGLSIPVAVAVKRPYVYWLDTEAFPVSIGRAGLNGTHVKRHFLSVQGTADAIAVAAAHIYWTTGSYTGHPAAVWRANRDGSHKRKLLSIGNGTFIGGLAINSKHIYWTNSAKGTIGRANLNGTGAELTFLAGLKNPTGVALDKQHLYWASAPSGGGGSLGRADLGGRHVDQHFIKGADGPSGLAVGAGHIYWANTGGGTIGRARLDGTHVNPGFIHARVLYMGADAADPSDVALGP